MRISLASARSSGRNGPRRLSARAPFWLMLGLLTMLASCAGPGSSPIAYRAITVDGRCSQTDEDGFRESATLKVQNNEVETLQWQLWVGKRGSCRFNGADFKQTKTRPHIELLSRDGSGCKLMVWRDDRRITLAHAGCEARCTSGVYEEAWPVMFDPSSGDCAVAR